MLSQVNAQDDEARFEVIENGTKRGGKNLVSNKGYSYVFKVRLSSQTLLKIHTITIQK